jgi:hypothetical protein
MEWNEDIVAKLNGLFEDKYKEKFVNFSWTANSSTQNYPIDRKNRSALWNKYLKNYDCKVIRNDIPGKKTNLRANEVLLSNIFNLINFQNELIANGLIIRNPDRFGQYILIPRDIAERILVLGMM